VLLADTISQAIGRAGRTGMLVGITVIDIDGFKEINDTFGHETGDECLKEIARRLKGGVRITDTVARLGGDEFVFIACECRTIEDLELAIKRLVDALSPRWVYGEKDLHLSVSCGVAVFPSNGANMTQLLVAADAAMYQAKRQGRSVKGDGGNTVRFFTDELNAQATERLTVGKNLRLALDAKEFFLVYQPQIEIKTGRITGFEALIRWQGMFQMHGNRNCFVVTCKRCHREVPSGRDEFPFQSITVECPLCGELRRYLPSEVFLGRPDQLVMKQNGTGSR
jgi:diguanylate cyclase (GGDEF)-like protein